MEHVRAGLAGGGARVVAFVRAGQAICVQARHVKTASAMDTVMGEEVLLHSVLNMARLL